MSKYFDKVVPSADNLAGAVTAFAGAAATTNIELQTATVPMVIREYYFGVNMATDWVIGDNLSVQAIMKDDGARDGFSNQQSSAAEGAAAHTSMTIKCTIVPMAVMVAEVAGIDIETGRHESEDTGALEEGGASATAGTGGAGTLG